MQACASQKVVRAYDTRAPTRAQQFRKFVIYKEDIRARVLDIYIHNSETIRATGLCQTMDGDSSRIL